MAGMTSHDVVRNVRRIFKTRKVGHGGTLDPLATGVLPVAIGDGTKILQFLLAEDKSYRATFQLGVTTDTLDADGQIEIERPIPEITADSLENICCQFRGKIQQLPPMYSAIKKDGVPLYKLARQGITVERKLRQVLIDRLEIISFDSKTVTIEVDCSKGTYIRTLISDMGEMLDCGAHLTELRRLQSGIFPIDKCQTLDQLQQLDEPSAALLTLDESMGCYLAVWLDEAGASSLEYGIPPQLNQVELSEELQEGQLVRLQIDQKLAALAKYMPQRIKEKRSDFELVRVFVSR